MIETIIDSYPEEEFLTVDGLSSAIIGVDENSMRLIYSVKKCIEIFVKDGMNEEDAKEYFEFNTRGSYMGEKTPIWCDDEF